MASCQLLKLLKQVQNFVDCGQSNWFTLKLMINSMLIRRCLTRFFIKIWGSRSMWSLFRSLTDELILPKWWSASWQMMVCWKFATHFIIWLRDNQLVFLFPEVKPASREKNISGHPDIKKNANGKLNAVPLDTFDDLYATSTANLLGNWTFSCEKGVRHFLVNNPCEIWGFLPQYWCWASWSSEMLHYALGHMTYSDVSKEQSKFIFNSWGYIGSSRTNQSWLWRFKTALKYQGTANYPVQSISSCKTSTRKETWYSSLERIKKVCGSRLKTVSYPPQCKRHMCNFTGVTSTCVMTQPHIHHNASGTCVTLFAIFYTSFKIYNNLHTL